MYAVRSSSNGLNRMIASMCDSMPRNSEPSQIIFFEIELTTFILQLQISFTFITFPTLVCAYSGQAAYLRKFPEQIGSTFYSSVPGEFLTDASSRLILVK
jgi:hypothetical protein